VSVDNGATWSPIFTYQGALMNRGEAPYFDHPYLTVPSAAGKKSVIFRFQAEGGDPGRYQGFWAVDNVRVTVNRAAVANDIRLGAVGASGSGVTLNWAGGAGPFAVQKKATLSDTTWMTVTDGATATVTAYKAILSGAAERPNPVTTSASGAGTLSLEGNKLTWDIVFSGLSANATAAHIHGPAGETEAAGVMIPLTAPSATSGRITGSATLTDVQLAAVVGGKAYVNLHTSTNPGGELRGQMLP
jgi:CHRD domain